MRNYLIIGGGSGIGKALLHKLHSEGHSIYSTYYNSPIEEGDGRIHVKRYDVLTEEFSTDFLPSVIDGLIYCPGAIQLTPFGRIKTEKLQMDLNLQVFGAIKTIQKVIPHLLLSEDASIVLFSSVAVQTGFKYHAQVAVSKGAIEGLVRSLASEYAPKIRVNAIAPSLTQTPLAEKFLSSEEKIKSNASRHPLQRIGTAKEVAELAAFLLSDQSGWITGSVIKIDGGISSVKV